MNPTSRLGGSDRHCWLMRRDLFQLPPPHAWPAHISLAAFTLADAPQAHALLQLAYADDGRMPDYACWVDAWQKDPEYEPALCFTLRDDLGIVGLIQGWTSAYIKDLVIHPRVRDQGLGLALLNHAFTAFHQRGEAWVDLKVMENNLAARCLYEKAGMRYIQREATDER